MRWRMLLRISSALGQDEIFSNGPINCDNCFVEVLRFISSNGKPNPIKLCNISLIDTQAWPLKMKEAGRGMLFLMTIFD